MEMKGNPISLIVKTAAQNLPLKRLFGTKGYVKLTVLADNFYVRVGDNTAPLAANTSVTSSAKTDDGITVQYTGTALSTGLAVGDIVQVTSGADALLGYAICTEIVSATVCKFRKITSNFTTTSGDKVIKFQSRKVTSAEPKYIQLDKILGEDGYISFVSDNGSASSINLKIEVVQEVPENVYASVAVASVTAGS